jgi:hypothetical protein
MNNDLILFELPGIGKKTLEGLSMVSTKDIEGIFIRKDSLTQ